MRLLSYFYGYYIFAFAIFWFVFESRRHSDAVVCCNEERGGSWFESQGLPVWSLHIVPVCVCGGFLLDTKLNCECECVWLFVSVCRGAVIQWRSVRRLSPNVSWDWLQPPPTPLRPSKDKQYR